MKLGKLLKQLAYCTRVDIQLEDDSHPAWRMFRYKGMLSEMPYDTYDLLYDGKLSSPLRVSDGTVHIELDVPKYVEELGKDEL